MRALALASCLAIAACASTPPVREIDLTGSIATCLAQGKLPARVRVDAAGEVNGVLCAAVRLNNPSPMRGA